MIFESYIFGDICHNPNLVMLLTYCGVRLLAKQTLDIFFNFENSQIRSFSFVFKLKLEELLEHFNLFTYYCQTPVSQFRFQESVIRLGVVANIFLIEVKKTHRNRIDVPSAVTL